MVAAANHPSSDSAKGDPQKAPFAEQWVKLSRQAYIALVAEAHRYRSLHQRAVRRIEALQQRLHEVEAAAAQRELALRAEIDRAEATIRDLRHRLFGEKNDRTKPDRQLVKKPSGSRRHRGQQPGTRGHGRRHSEQLPVREEILDPETKTCPACGASLAPFPGTDDCEIIEVAVRAYRRIIRRRRYRCTCDCHALPAIVTAPPVPRLIERGKYGLSVWVMVLLDKYVYGRPSHRLLEDLADLGVVMPAGSLDGGLRALVPLLEPLDGGLHEQLCRESHWHADETRWPVFIEYPGKSGHRWCLWVFSSKSVVHYVVDPSRSAAVVENELAGVESGVISCDRLSVYQRFARQHPGIQLSLCWAHQRRDFLELAIRHPELEEWALVWVAWIGELYRLRNRHAMAEVEALLQQMATTRDAMLNDNTTPEAAQPVLQSLKAHWAGLTRFVDDPQLPLDNNTAERFIRTPVVGRKNFYGSGSDWSAHLAAMMYSLAMTAQVWGINIRSWLQSYLHACIDHGNHPPSDLAPFLPWQMSVPRLNELRASGSTPPASPYFDTS